MITNKERRKKLGRELAAIPGVKKVYFQPPELEKLSYPCIVYEIDSASTDYADNQVYNFRWRYQVTVIDKDPDNDIRNIILTAFPYVSFQRFYTSNSLNHWVFILYY